MDIGKSNAWQKNAKQRRKSERLEHVLNVTKKNISPEITKGNS